MKMKSIINQSNILNIILLLLTISSCNNQKQKEIGEETQSEEITTNGVVTLTQEQISTVGIKTDKIEKRQMSGNIQATGTLKLSPQNRAEVSSLVTGITKQILVKEGDKVSAGQALAMVENTEIVAMQKDYLIASHQLILARQAYARQQAIKSQGAGIEKNLQQAKSDLDIATVTEQGLRQQLKQLGISPIQVSKGKFIRSVPVRSPISGIVGEILISTGSYLNNDTKLMNIYNNNALHADINVFESNIANIKIGQSVELQLSDKSAPRLKGKVAFITASMDKNTKSASVHVTLKPQSGITLLPNMFVSASILCGNQLCDAVPDDAIVMIANHNYVFVCLGKGKFQQAEVICGISQQGYTQIKFVDKQMTNAEIVTSKAFYLQSMVSDHGEEE